MDLRRAELTLRNPVDSTLEALVASALVDTGALYLCVPEHGALQLKLAELETREK